MGAHLHPNCTQVLPSYRHITSFFVSCKCSINLCPFFNRLVVVVVLKNGVVVQTKKHSEVKQETQESSTISRYSCRSLADREPSHTAYVFAGGFDKSNNIFLGVRKPAICLYLKHRISPTRDYFVTCNCTERKAFT